MKNNYTSKQKLQRLTTAGVLAALSLVLMATVRFPIFPTASFYEMEFSDVPLLLCSTVVGPVYAIISLFIVCVIQAVTVSSGSGFIGFVMHFISSGLMILVVYFVRKKIDGLKGVIISNVLGVIVMTLVMIPMNVWMVSEFLKIDFKGFVSGFLGVCIAFNLIKSTTNLTIFSLISPVLTKEFNKLFNKDK
ncbi:MAG: ECF transporter S component [Clostridia bacterium]|nr:ECF transporter S component [Clostridia bacterium]